MIVIGEAPHGQQSSVSQQVANAVSRTLAGLGRGVVRACAALSVSRLV
jgi:hypothetical protein